MKKMLINKMQSESVKNVDVKEHKINDSQQKSPTTITSPTNNHQQRKLINPYLRELFRVLLNVPDKALQKRVIDAINEHNATANNLWTCKQCLRKSSHQVKCVDSATQTNLIVEEYEESPTPSLPTSPSETPPPRPPPAQAKPTEKGAKRGRKRKTCVPQVVKRSHAQLAQQERDDKQLTPLTMKKRKTEVLKQDKIVSTDTFERMAKEEWFNDLIGDGFQEDNFIEVPISNEKMVEAMLNEYHFRNQYNDGLLPIHHAILRNDYFGLKRQIYVWTHHEPEDLNNLITEDGEDCLELAIVNDSLPSIVELLLEFKLYIDVCYNNSNNIIHMAIINNVNLNSLELLMKRIDLKMLLQLNDDGYTPMHIAVRHNLYCEAAVICNEFDRRTIGRAIHERPVNEKKFSKYYEHACDKLATTLQHIDMVYEQKLKRQLLDMCETRSGNTALFYAIESEMEHFSYLLLAHLSDPTIENHSSQSPKLFHYEYARTLQINLKVARIMDKVIGILQNGFKPNQHSI